MRLVDDDGFEVPPGAVGELVVRPNEPSLMADGYLGLPDVPPFDLRARGRDEARRFRLAFCCDDCANWHQEKQACSILFPSAPHRREHVEQLDDGERMYFCKMFEAR